MNVYETLDVPKDATEEEILEAYRKAAKATHPDKHPNDPEAKEKFQKVQLAFTILNDPLLRRKYDQTGSTDTMGFDENREVASLLAAAFSQVLDTIIDRVGDVRQINIVHMLQEHLSNIRNQESSQLKTALRKLAHLKEASERLSTAAAADNLLASIARAPIAQLERAIEEGKLKLQVIDKARELVNTYSYRCDIANPFSKSNRGQTPWSAAWAVSAEELRSAFQNVRDDAYNTRERP